MGTFGGAQPIVTDGLVFAVDAANYQSYPGSGTTWSDMVGGNNGTLVNGPTFDEANGGSLMFTSDDYCIFSDNLTFDIVSDFSLSVWFKPYNGIHGRFAGVFCKGNGVSFGNWGLYGDGASSSTYIRFGFLDTNNNQQEVSNPSYPDLTSTEWVNYQGVFSTTDTSLRLYRNGIQIAIDNTISTTPQTNDYSVYIGVRLASLPSYRFNGYIPNCIFYNRALTDQEITQNYNALKSRFGL